MEISYLVATLSLAPYFASRALIPLFASALVARFGTEWGFLADMAGIELIRDLPAWILSDTSLMVLGVGAVAEVIWNKSPDLRQMASLGDPWVKGMAALGMSLLLAPQMAAANPAVAQAGIGDLTPLHLWALLVAGMTWLLASLRNNVYEFLYDVDEEDDLGLQGFLSWVEDGIGFLGVLFVVILPTVALAVVGLTLLALFVLQKILEHRERRQFRACPECGVEGPPCGPVCARCGAINAQPVGVGLLGMLRKEPAAVTERHCLDLLAGKRCRRCGHRLKGKSFDLRCAECGALPFDTEAELETYLAHIGARLPKVLVVLLAFSAVPLVGLIPGVIYYRLSLVASLRHYIPRGSRFLGRWTARVVAFVLLVLQPIPVLGALSLPLLAYANYRIYGRLLRKAGAKALNARPALPSEASAT